MHVSLFLLVQAAAKILPFGLNDKRKQPTKGLIRTIKLKITYINPKIPNSSDMNFAIMRLSGISQGLLGSLIRFPLIFSLSRISSSTPLVRASLMFLPVWDHDRYGN